ncbi:hypothetical protein LTR09_008426 [Extremus antarcticus]|uniref:NB-ARC domain-containing protein n=1 Tax=Extremus antarcticus TaxID=702011 RepID=A0AAJ0DHC8_9PEZI|nr:hypothetical protein LTR09_008426 [Extremus antarcticus]
MGGAGKTQICLQYAHTHRDRYWGVFWIDASSNESIQMSMKQMASVLGLEQNVESLRRELTNTAHTWLLVFDNADDPDVSLTRYFPSGGRGDVIITSRNPGCQQYSTVGHEEIGRMTRDEAHILFSKTAYGQVQISEEIANATGQVVDALGCLALAVAHAGAYIRKTGYHPVEYLQIYSRRYKELLSFLPVHSGTDYKHTVYTTWQVSIDAITSTPGEASAGALKIVRLVCFLHYDQIPLEVFFRASNAGQSQEDAAWLPWPSTLNDPFDVRYAVQEAVALLASFSLLRRDTNASLSFHPLVHEWCRKRIGEDDEHMCCLHAISLLGRSVDWKFTMEDYGFRRKLVSHVQSCLHQWRDVHGGVKNGHSADWSALALILSENGFAAEAIQLEEPLLQLRKGKLGPDHPNTIASMHNLAIRYSEAGRREEALKLTIRYSEAGRREEALKLSEEVVGLRKGKLRPDHPDTIASIHSLAIFYSEAGRREEALKLSEEVVGLGKAIRYSEAGRREEALKLSEEVVGLRKGKLGPDHPDTIASMHSLAIFYSEAGRREEALKLSEEVVGLGKVIRYSEAGRREEALKLSEEVVGLRKGKLGANHPNTLESTKLHAYLSVYA